MDRSGHRVTFCGHVHVPILYNHDAAGRIGSLPPAAPASGCRFSPAAMARGDRRRRPAAGRVAGRRLRALRHGEEHLRFMRVAYDANAPRGRSARPACRRRLPFASWQDGEMRKRLHSGMWSTASSSPNGCISAAWPQIWRAARDGGEIAAAHKVPLIRDSDDPTPIVGFEVEQMILPRLSGPHVPRFVAQGDFSMQPYIAMELLPGPVAEGRGSTGCRCRSTEVAAIGAKDGAGAARHSPPARDPSRRQAEQHHAARERRGGADRFRLLAPRAAARPPGRGVPPAVRHRALHVAGTGAAGSADRSAQRPLRARRHAVFLRDGGASLRQSARRARPAPAALARSGAAAGTGTPIARPGCRRSSCAASRSTRRSATPPRRSSPSISSNPEQVALTERAAREARRRR